jgi:hypothetical protein
MSPLHGVQPQGHVTFKFGNSEFFLPEVPAISAGEVVLKCDSKISTSFRDWLSARIRGHAGPSDCAVRFYKYDNEELMRHELKMALVSSIIFPALDASAFDLARLTVKLKAKNIAQIPGSGKMQVAIAKGPSMWRRRDFHLLVDGLSTNMVSQIDAIRMLDAGSIPNVKASVASMDAAGFKALKQSGKAVAAKLRYLFPDLQTAFVTLQFSMQVVSILDVAGSSQVPGARTGGTVAKTSFEFSIKNPSLSTL